MAMSKDTPIIPIAIDHGFSAIKTPHFCFTTGISEIDEPITQDNTEHFFLMTYRKDVRT